MKTIKFDSKTIVPIVMAGAGGFVGNQLTTQIEKQSFMAGKEQYAPLVTAALGIGGAMFLPKMTSLFIGVATVATTELLENLINTKISSATVPQTQGVQHIQRNPANIQGVGYNATPGNIA